MPTINGWPRLSFAVESTILNAYSDHGAGIRYVLKPKEGIVANLELAAGKGNNYGISLGVGYGF